MDRLFIALVLFALIFIVPAIVILARAGKVLAATDKLADGKGG